MTGQLRARFVALDACAVSDALDALGLPSAVTGLRRLAGQGVLAGPVATIQLVEGPAPADAPKVHLGARTIDAAQPGTVIVVAHPGIDAGGWGGVLSNGAQANGVAGVIVDGSVRDSDEAAALGFPIFGRTTTARTARGRLHEAAVDVPVVIGGNTVSPGDWVVCDASGAAFIPASRLEDVAERAEKIADRERLMSEALHAGRAAIEVLGADYENLLENRG